MTKDKAIKCAMSAATQHSVPYVAIKASNGQWMRERKSYADKHYTINAERLTFYPTTKFTTQLTAAALKADPRDQNEPEDEECPFCRGPCTYFD